MNRFFLFLFLFFSAVSYGQFIPVPINQDNLYTFLHELQSEQIIDADLSVLPLSRKQVLIYLKQAETLSDKLNKSQQLELKQYLSAYNIKSATNSSSWIDLLSSSKRANFHGDAFYYQDSLFTFAVNPIIGVSYAFTDTTKNYKRRNGASAYGTYKNWSLWVNLRDNYADITTNKVNYLANEIFPVILSNILINGFNSRDYSFYRLKK